MTETTLNNILDQTKKELKNSLALVSAVFEATTDAIWVVDVNHQTRMANRQFYQMWQLEDPLPPDDQLLAHLLSFTIDDTEFTATWNELHAYPEVESHDFLALKDGRFIERYSMPQITPDDEIIGRVWHFRDITEQRMAEKSRDRALNHLASFSDHLRQLHRLSTTNYASYQAKYADYLKTGAAIFQMEYATISQIKGNEYHLKVVHAPDNRIKTGKVYALADMLSATVNETGKTLAIHDLGHPQWASHPAYTQSGMSCFLGTPLYVNNELYGTLSFISTTPSPAPLAEHIIELIELMGQSIATAIEQEKAEAFQNKMLERLRDARDDAESANRAKSTFLANMSHELRTPLTAIIGYSELLIEQADMQGDDQLSNRLQKIGISANHLLSVISDILDLSKIEAGRIDLYRETFAIRDWLEQTSVTIHPLAKQNNNQLELKLADNLGFLYVDQGKIRQVLLNLLSNAAKFTSDGTITLEAKEEQIDNDPWLIISVTDTGIGLSKEQQMRLFTPFTQADASTTRKYGGTGLGLAISQRYCQMHGGSIDVQSELGQGACFTVRLPILEIAQKQTAVHTPPLPQIHTHLPTTGTILIIDDEQSTRESLEHWMTQQGFDVLTATNGVEGLKLAQKQQPDLIVLDLFMPEMDGWQVLAELKNTPLLQEIPVILVSIVDDKEKSVLLGATDYLVKPIKRAHIERMIYKHLPKAGKTNNQILVVEDDSHMSDFLKIMLQDQGWQVDVAKNGRQALEAVQNQSPDLILLDLMLPEVNGFDILQQVSEQIPIIVLTAKDLSRHERQILHQRVKNVIKKGSFRTEDLLSKINYALGTS